MGQTAYVHVRHVRCCWMVHHCAGTKVHLLGICHDAPINVAAVHAASAAVRPAGVAIEHPKGVNMEFTAIASKLAAQLEGLAGLSLLQHRHQPQSILRAHGALAPADRGTWRDAWRSAGAVLDHVDLALLLRYGRLYGSELLAAAHIVASAVDQAATAVQGGAPSACAAEAAEASGQAMAAEAGNRDALPPQGAILFEAIDMPTDQLPPISAHPDLSAQPSAAALEAQLAEKLLGSCAGPAFARWEAAALAVPSAGHTAELDRAIVQGLRASSLTPAMVAQFVAETNRWGEGGSACQS